MAQHAVRPSSRARALRRVAAFLVLVAIGSLVGGCGLRRELFPPVNFPIAAPSQVTTYSTVIDTIYEGGMPAVERKYGKPTSSFRMPDITNSTEATAVYALPDGRQYVFSWGFSSTGAPIVVRHTVLATEGVTLTSADRSFVAAAKDGVTPVKQLDAFLKKVSGGTWKPVPPRTSTTRDVIWLWTYPDGSGFTVSTVRGHRKLAMTQYAGVPYVVWDWPADHLWSYVPQ